MISDIPLKKSKSYKCEDCRDTGWGGDFCHGIRGNNEYAPCHCRSENITIASEIDKLRCQRDELVQVLRDCIGILETFVGTSENSEGAVDFQIDEARAALSRIGKEEV